MKGLFRPTLYRNRVCVHYLLQVCFHFPYSFAVYRTQYNISSNTSTANLWVENKAQLPFSFLTSSTPIKAILLLLKESNELKKSARRELLKLLELTRNLQQSEKSTKAVRYWDVGENLSSPLAARAAANGPSVGQKAMACYLQRVVQLPSYRSLLLQLLLIYDPIVKTN